MSSSLVRKSLAIVDDTNEPTSAPNSSKKKKRGGLQVPINKKLHIVQGKSKLTVAEARKQLKSKGQILKNNLAKLKRIKEIEKVQLDNSVRRLIIDRAVSRRPVKQKRKSKPKQRTAFTEEDFKKFETEYLE